jgi:hypothetical protein
MYNFKIFSKSIDSYSCGNSLSMNSQKKQTKQKKSTMYIVAVLTSAPPEEKNFQFSIFNFQLILYAIRASP